MGINLQMVFDPVKIAGLADTIEQQRRILKEQLEAAAKAARNVTTSWRGPASDAFAKEAAKLDTDATELLALLDKHALTLRQVSGVYEKGESAAKTQAKSLPTEGVFL